MDRVVEQRLFERIGIRVKAKTLKKIGVMFLVNHILGVPKFFEAKNKLLRSVGYEIGKGSKVVGSLFCTAFLSVGCDRWIGRGLTVHGNGNVSIGDNCDIAPDVTFLTGGHEIGDSSHRAGKGETYSISVGDGVWIGARSTIGRNVRIGSGSVVAACSCVMNDVPDNVLVGGVPAKVIKELPND